jgi:type II secretory pathway component PulK
MKLSVANPGYLEARLGHDRGSVLVIVLWVAFGLVSIALYFAHSMSFELRAADNRVASLEAEQAIAGAARYVSNILMSVEQPGVLPDVLGYRSEAVPVGDATFWLLGRDDRQTVRDLPAFGLVDEASKLNLNSATIEMLQLLPRMTPELAAAIIDWRDSDSNASTGGAEDETYQRLNPAYRCKNAPFESVDELRLIFGMDLDILYGEDPNRNGILDLNENDGDVSFPYDNRDGRLDPGLLEYVTIYSRESNTRADGSARINVSSADQQQQLAAALAEHFDADRVNQILSQLGGGGGRGGQGGGGTTIRSLLEFYLLSGMTPEEFAQIEGDVIVSNNTNGLVNVNTASEAVLTCIPGIGTENAAALVAHRLSNPNQVQSVAWVAEVLERENALQAGPYLTGRSYQFTADIAAVGHYGRGYRRVRFVFDTSDATARILYRQDLTDLGWALSRQVRETIRLANSKR